MKKGFLVIVISLIIVFFTIIQSGRALTFNNASSSSRTLLSSSKGKAYVQPYYLMYKLFTHFNFRELMRGIICNFASAWFHCESCTNNSSPEPSTTPVPTIPPMIASTPPPDETATQAPEECPPDQRPNNLIAIVPQYIFVEVPLNWMEAQINCKLQGYDLTTVEDMKEYDLINHWIRQSNSSAISEGTIWIGGNDIFREGNFTWISNGKAVEAFLPSGNPEPTGLPDENCMLLYPVPAIHSHVMGDYACFVPLASICKRSQTSIAITSPHETTASSSCPRKE